MELEFRDGKRFVPEYLADLMGGLDTYRYTYEEAIKMVNRSLLGNAVGDLQNKMIDQHFRENR